MASTMDRRVIRTKKNIQQAFIELMNEKGFEAITVQDIADRADINRGTFYLHYLDKYDLYERRVDDLLEELVTAFTPTEDEKKLQDAHKFPDQLIIRLFTHLQQHRDFYKTMCEEGSSTYFLNRFMEVLLSHLRDNIVGSIAKLTSRDTNPVNIEIMTQCMLFSLLGVLKYWMDQEPPYTPEYMANQLKTIYDYEFEMLCRKAETSI